MQYGALLSTSFSTAAPTAAPTSEPASAPASAVNAVRLSPFLAPPPAAVPPASAPVTAPAMTASAACGPGQATALIARPSGLGCVECVGIEEFDGPTREQADGLAEQPNGRPLRECPSPDEPRKAAGPSHGECEHCGLGRLYPSPMAWPRGAPRGGAAGRTGLPAGRRQAHAGAAEEMGGMIAPGRMQGCLMPCTSRTRSHPRMRDICTPAEFGQAAGETARCTLRTARPTGAPRTIPPGAPTGRSGHKRVRRVRDAGRWHCRRRGLPDRPYLRNSGKNCGSGSPVRGRHAAPCPDAGRDPGGSDRAVPPLHSYGRRAPPPIVGSGQSRPRPAKVSPPADLRADERAADAGGGTLA